MTTNRHAHFEGPGLDKVDDLFRNRVRRNRLLKEMVERWGAVGHSSAIRHAPSRTGYLVSQIQSTGARYAPGRAGGGGGTTLTVGVKKSESKHPIYVHFGTANPEDQDYTSFASAGITPEKQGKIYPVRAKALGPLPEKGTYPLFQKSVSGQAAQPYVYFAYLDTVIYSRAELRATVALLEL